MMMTTQGGEMEDRCAVRVRIVFFSLLCRSSTNNAPLSGIVAQVSFDGCIDTYTSDSSGTIRISIFFLFVTYNIQLSGDDFINSTMEYMAESDEDEMMLVPLSPTLEPGEVRMMMSWETLIVDVDILMVGVPRDGSGNYCRTWWNSRTGCPGSELDLDNTGTGLEGSETITLTDPSINVENIYVIGVNHYFNGNFPLMDEFLQSHASVTFLNNIDSVTEVIDANGTIPQPVVPRLDAWFAGCLTVDSSGGFTVQTAPTQVYMPRWEAVDFAAMANTYCGGPTPVEDNVLDLEDPVDNGRKLK